MTSAKIICDSVSPNGVRLTTFEVTFHRFILAELNTHRVFSRNSASSRAIPTAKIIDRIENNLALPLSWGSNKPGMQAGEEIQEPDLATCKRIWRGASAEAIIRVEKLNDYGLHKQTANRLLEPFMWHAAIITAVDFDNFFHQRCHPAAQPEMKSLADAMQFAYFTNEPELLEVGEWHLPFVSEDDRDNVLSSGLVTGNSGSEEVEIIEILKKISVARCARVSYLNHDGRRNIVNDFNLFNKLSEGMHWSPFEHVATPCTDSLKEYCKLSGNFGRGWHQYRKFFQSENRTKFIPNLPELAEVTEQMRSENA